MYSPCILTTSICTGLVFEKSVREGLSTESSYAEGSCLMRCICVLQIWARWCSLISENVRYKYINMPVDEKIVMLAVYNVFSCLQEGFSLASSRT